MNPSALSPHAEIILERTARILADEVRNEARVRFGTGTASEPEAAAATGTDGTVLPFPSRRS